MNTMAKTNHDVTEETTSKKRNCDVDTMAKTSRDVTEETTRNRDVDTMAKTNRDVIEETTRNRDVDTMAKTSPDVTEETTSKNMDVDVRKDNDWSQNMEAWRSGEAIGKLKGFDTGVQAGHLYTSKYCFPPILEHARNDGYDDGFNDAVEGGRRHGHIQGMINGLEYACSIMRHGTNTGRLSAPVMLVENQALLSEDQHRRIEGALSFFEGINCKR